MSVQVQSTRLHCSACDHIWSGNILSYVPIKVWVLHAKSLRCPECFSKKLNIVFDEDKLRASIDAKKGSAAT